MKTILVIDKDYPTLLMLKEEFEGAGYEVLTTESGKEALKILNDPAKSVDLVITNLRHAGPNMMDFIRFIKKTWPTLPVICHTALYEYLRLPPQDQPFDDFVEKSSDLAGLKHSVEKLINTKQ
ncbi:MAG: response regulator [Desulfobaccales bacterium]